jgi:hypothetical protein
MIFSNNVMHAYIILCNIVLVKIIYPWKQLRKTLLRVESF